MSSCPNTDADPDVAIRYFTLGLNWAIHCCQKFYVVLWPDYVKNCTKKRAALLYFLASPIKSLILWRCRGPCCRHFLNSPIINSDRVSLDLERAQSLRERNRKTSIQIFKFYIIWSMKELFWVALNTPNKHLLSKNYHWYERKKK